MSEQQVRPYAPGKFPVLPDGVYSLSLGNISRFTVAIIRKDGPLAGNHPDNVIGTPYMDGLFVAVEGCGAYTFRSAYDPGYVDSKLHLGIADATNLTDFIDCQLGVKREAPFGRYLDDLVYEMPGRHQGLVRGSVYVHPKKVKIEPIPDPPGHKPVNAWTKWAPDEVDEAMTAALKQLDDAGVKYEIGEGGSVHIKDPVVENFDMLNWPGMEHFQVELDSGWNAVLTQSNG